MNPDDIRRIAKEAGLAGAKLSAGLEEMRLDMWERFAELVAAAEREAALTSGGLCSLSALDLPPKMISSTASLRLSVPAAFNPRKARIES